MYIVFGDCHVIDNTGSFQFPLSPAGRSIGLLRNKLELNKDTPLLASKRRIDVNFLGAVTGSPLPRAATPVPYAMRCPRSWQRIDPVGPTCGRV